MPAQPPSSEPPHSQPPRLQFDLAATLVRITRELGTGIEHLRAEQLLTEARAAMPGEPEERWAEWLTEGARGLGLQAKQKQLTLEQALSLAQDGALLIGDTCVNDEPTILLDFDGKCAELATSCDEGCQRHELARLMRGQTPGEESPWLIISDLEFSHTHASKFVNNPVRRFLSILKPEWSDIWVVAVFAFFAGVLGLATPIAVEALVNMVAFGRLIQPLLVLSILLFGFLAFAAMMRALQTFVVEIIQRRLFVRIAADLAYRFPRVTQTALHGEYGPELANRFFDVVTLQKVVAQLLVDGLAIVLTTIVGMAVLAFYHPWLLGFDVLLLAIVIGGLLLLGRGAISTGIDESKKKYRLAAWLEDVIRCSVGFKTAGGAEFALDRANLITSEYLSARRKHFALLFRQILFILSLQALAGTILLGFGGWLVIQRQLTLGQLVAAELIVATILSSLAKLGKHLEGFYDVIASVDKLGHLFDLKIAPQDGLLSISPGKGARLRITDVAHSAGGPLLKRGLTLSVDPLEQVAVLLPQEAGCCVLFDILYGLRTPENGHVEIEHADPRDLSPETLRAAVSLVRGIELFEGTVAENIHLGRPHVCMSDVRWALQSVGLLDDILRLPEGLDTAINATGVPLSKSQQTLLMIARGICSHPRVLLLDGTLDGLSDRDFETVRAFLLEERPAWTLLVATARSQVADQFERMVELESKVTV